MDDTKATSALAALRAAVARGAVRAASPEDAAEEGNEALAVEAEEAFHVFESLAKLMISVIAAPPEQEA